MSRLTSTTQSKKSSPRSPSVSIIICISPRSKLASKPGIPAHYWPCIFNAILLLQFILDFLETGDNASIKMVSTNGFFNRVAWKSQLKDSAQTLRKAKSSSVVAGVIRSTIEFGNLGRRLEIPCSVSNLFDWNYWVTTIQIYEDQSVQKKIYLRSFRLSYFWLPIKKNYTCTLGNQTKRVQMRSFDNADWQNQATLHSP